MLLRLALEIISELRDPLELESVEEEASQEFNAEELQSKINELTKHKSILTTKQAQKRRSAEDRKKDEKQIQQLESEIEELNEALQKTSKSDKKVELDGKIWCQCLEIAIFLLQNTNKKVSTSWRSLLVFIDLKSFQALSDGGIAGLYGALIQGSLQHTLPVVRVRGLCSLILFSLLDYNTAASHIPLFFHILRNDLPHVQLVALKV